MNARRPAPAFRRGLSLLELMLALTITTIVAGAIWSMMSAVSLGVRSRRDDRAALIAANAASIRIGAYVGPSRCILEADGDPLLVLWLDDTRQSGTVHLSEVRWLVHDVAEGTIDVRFVQFPADWTPAQIDLADTELPAGSDWDAILATAESRGLIATMPLVDGLDAVALVLDEAAPLDARHLEIELEFSTAEGSMALRIGPTIRLHRPPDF